jgi:hypothetical protein
MRVPLPGCTRIIWTFSNTVETYFCRSIFMTKCLCVCENFCSTVHPNHKPNLHQSISTFGWLGTHPILSLFLPYRTVDFKNEVTHRYIIVYCCSYSNFIFRPPTKATFVVSGYCTYCVSQGKLTMGLEGCFEVCNIVGIREFRASHFLHARFSFAVWFAFSDL